MRHNGDFMKLNYSSQQLKKIGIILLVLFIIFAVVKHFTARQTMDIPLPKVIVNLPVQANLVEYVTQTGTTVAYNSVDLVARVEGYLDAIEFVDGSYVNKGKELFVIQPEPYMEQLISAKAQVAIANADYAYSKSEYARQKKMYAQNATSLNNVEKWQAKIEESAANVEKAVANEKLAEITYSYTHVAAPFDGRIGRHLVSIGNLVGNGVATNLATIEQINPLYVYFNLNELDLIKLRDAARQVGFKPSDLNTVPVDIALQGSSQFNYHATLDFINTGLNASTGTMELRAILDNKENIFVPGLFVNVRIAITRPTPQLTVPDTAILYDQIGPYLLIVDKKNIVQLKRVILGPHYQRQQGILRGINKTDQVIVDGIQNAVQGNSVEIVKDIPA